MGNIKTFEGYQESEINYKKVVAFLDKNFDMNDKGTFILKHEIPEYDKEDVGEAPDMHESPIAGINNGEWHDLSDRYKK